MPLVEPGATGAKTETEAVAPIKGGNPGQKRRLGLTFWLSAGWIFALVFLALFRDILPIRDPDELGIRTREVAKFESPGWNAFFGGDGQGRTAGGAGRGGEVGGGDGGGGGGGGGACALEHRGAGH